MCGVLTTRRRIDASTRQRVDMFTRRRVDASTRRRVDVSTHRRVEVSTRRVESEVWLGRTSLKQGRILFPSLSIVDVMKYLLLLLPLPID